MPIKKAYARLECPCTRVQGLGFRVVQSSPQTLNNWFKPKRPPSLFETGEKSGVGKMIGAIMGGPREVRFYHGESKAVTHTHTYIYVNIYIYIYVYIQGLL